MNYVFDWSKFAKEELKDFININIDESEDLSFLYSFVDKLYRGESKEDVILTDKIIKFENNYMDIIEGLPKYPLYQIASNLNSKDIINLCKSDKMFEFICEEDYFWRFNLSKRSRLDIKFFIPFTDGKLRKLVKDYEIFESVCKVLKRSNSKYICDYESLKPYNDIMNNIYLNDLKKRKEYQMLYNINGESVYFNVELKKGYEMIYPDVDYGGILTIKYLIETYDAVLGDTISIMNEYLDNKTFILLLERSLETEEFYPFIDEKHNGSLFDFLLFIIINSEIDNFNYYVNKFNLDLYEFQTYVKDEYGFSVMYYVYLDEDLNKIKYYENLGFELEEDDYSILTGVNIDILKHFINSHNQSLNVIERVVEVLSINELYLDDDILKYYNELKNDLLLSEIYD